MDVRETIMERFLQGRCCSEIIMELGLELRGETNEQLVDAAGALCLGLCGGHNCGALTAGALLLALFDSKLAQGVMIPDLLSWFQSECGAIDCRDIAGENLEFRSERCIELTAGVYEHCLMLLDEAGLL